MPASSSSSLPATFDALFREHAEGLHRLIRSRTADAASVDDILQETFVRFYRFYVAPGRLDSTRPVGPLLATIATREAARRGRAVGRQRSVDCITSLRTTQDSVGSDEHVATLHDVSLAREALNNLSPRQRRLLLQWELRRSTEALAATEQVTTAALKQAVMRARQQFRRQYVAVTTSAKALGAMAMPERSWLRAHIQPDPWWPNLAAVGLGLAGWSAVALLPLGVANKAVDVVASRAGPVSAVPIVATDVTPVPVAFTALAGGFESSHPSAGGTDDLPSNVRPERATTGHVDNREVHIDFASEDASGSTRSVKEVTVYCGAGVTAAAICEVIDLMTVANYGAGTATSSQNPFGDP